MESVLEFSTRCRQDSIKFTKKMLKGQMLWVVFNISLVCFDWVTFINSPSKLSSFSFGAMAITTLWSFMFMLETWRELKADRHHLKFLTELENSQIASAERQQFINAKNDYEQLIEKFKGATA